MALVLMPEGHSKLEASYSGPYPITEKVSPVTYHLDMPNHGKKAWIVHVNLLKSWETLTAHAVAVAVVPDGFSEYEGELIALQLGGKEVPKLSNNLSR